MTAETILGSGEEEEDEVAASLAMKRTAFDALPDEIIEQIMCLTDPDSFASLVLLTRKWRIISQQAHLYAHHLSRCPSYAAAHHSIPLLGNDDRLLELRKLFVREVKRNLFEAYLRPTETVINLVSTSIGASSAPGGEAFHFSFSPQGRYILAYSSSRIHVLDVTGADIQVKRELKILRRPALTTISDDGSTLAVLSTDLQIDLYDLSRGHPKHSRAVVLDYTPRTIALSPTGSVLAAAYDSGVEVSSLDLGCTSADKRAVKCYAVDSLSFSRNGTQLLGTTMHSSNPSTVVLSAPYYNPGSSLQAENVSELWTTSILFPNGSRDCSHAVLLPGPSDDEAVWTFTYDRVFETFRAVRIDDLRNGTTYFTGPTADSAAKLLPSTLPAASASGDLVAAGFQGSIWIYGVPEDLEAVPTISLGSNSNHESEVSTPSSQLGHKNSVRSTHSATKSQESKGRTPQWQLLCDRFRNTFIEGRKISSLDGATAMNWVSGDSRAFYRERLVAVAPGVGASPTAEDGEGISPVDGGRITMLDFSYAVKNGQKIIITIEVGANEPEVLEEERRDLDTEVALLRRRTVAQRRGLPSGISRSATTMGLTTHTDIPSTSSSSDPTDPFTTPRPVGRHSTEQMSTDQSEVASIDEQEAFDAPYSHTSPRSGPTLRRAATAAAVNRRLHPRAVAQEHIEYRRADGREEHPHESDADNWVPPPPPYTKDPVPTLPEHIQRSILAETAQATLTFADAARTPGFDVAGSDSGIVSRPYAFVSSNTGDARRESYPSHRTLSHSTIRSSGGRSVDEEVPRPFTSPTTSGFDDLYDVSPPGSPQLAPRRSQLNQIRRRPVSLAFTGGASLTGQNLASPSLVMRATLQQPASPIPQPMNEPLHSRLMEWESRDTMNHESAIVQALSTGDPAASTSSVVLTRDRLDREVPERPNDEHRLKELPPTTPEVQHRREMLESLPQRLPRRGETTPASSSNLPLREDPQPTWRRANTAPAAPALSAMPPISPLSPGFTMPSSDQIARLNNRKSRPPSHILADPSKRTSGISLQSLNSLASPSASQDTASYYQTEQNYRSTPPRSAVGAHGSAAPRTRTPYSDNRNPHNLPPRPLSLGNSRHGSQSYPNLRPSLQRLDTIHSMGSTGEASPFFAPKPMTLGRQPSKAQRSAAKNIQDAKKKGWRASMRKDRDKEKDKERQKVGDGASSAGWTDVSRESGSVGGSRSAGWERRSGGKCLVM